MGHSQQPVLFLVVLAPFVAMHELARDSSPPSHGVTLFTHTIGTASKDNEDDQETIYGRRHNGEDVDPKDVQTKDPVETSS